MLNVMRENLARLKWVLWLVAFSMILYLGYYFISPDDDPSSDAWAAKVDGEMIPTSRFLDVARRQDDAYRRAFGEQYEQFRKQFKLGSQIIQGLVDTKIMLAEARKLGLAATAADISERITTDPSFRDAAGNFVGRDRYVEAVNAAWAGGVPAFEREIAEEIAVRKWIALVTESATVTDEDVEKTYRDRNEKAAFDYVFAPSGAQKIDTAVSEADLRSWYDSHQDSYRRGEARRIRFVVAERQAQVPKATVSEEEVQAFYQASAADFARPEQRRASHILFRIDPASGPEDKKSIRDLAESVLRRAKEGEDFATLATTLSQDPGSAKNGGDLGFFGKGAMVPPFEQAAFATPVGSFAPVVETDFGFHIIKVTDARAAGTAPLDEVRESIRRTLEVRKAQEMLQAEGQRLRSAVKSPADLDVVATKENLAVEERIVSREDPGKEIGASPAFLDAVFALAPDQVSEPVPLARGLAIVTLVEVVPPGVRPLDEVRPQVTNDVLSHRSREAAVAAARRALAGAKDLEDAARRLGGTVERSGDVSRGFVLNGPGRSPDLEAVIFGAAAAVGSQGVQGVPGGAVIYKITRHDVFDAGRFLAAKEGLRDELIGERRNALLRGVLEGLRAKHEVEINQRVIEATNG